MRALLLNDNGYTGLEAVQFPVEVDVVPEYSNVFSVAVSVAGLERIGANMKHFSFLPAYTFALEGHMSMPVAAQILES